MQGNLIWRIRTGSPVVTEMPICSVLTSRVRNVGAQLDWLSPTLKNLNKKHTFFNNNFFFPWVNEMLTFNWRRLCSRIWQFSSWLVLFDQLYSHSTDFGGSTKCHNCFSASSDLENVCQVPLEQNSAGTATRQTLIKQTICSTVLINVSIFLLP